MLRSLRDEAVEQHGDDQDIEIPWSELKQRMMNMGEIPVADPNSFNALLDNPENGIQNIVVNVDNNGITLSPTDFEEPEQDVGQGAEQAPPETPQDRVGKQAMKSVNQMR